MSLRAVVVALAVFAAALAAPATAASAGARLERLGLAKPTSAVQHLKLAVHAEAAKPVPAGAKAAAAVEDNEKAEQDKAAGKPPSTCHRYETKTKQEGATDEDKPKANPNFAGGSPMGRLEGSSSSSSSGADAPTDAQTNGKVHFCMGWGYGKDAKNDKGWKDVTAKPAAASKSPIL